MQLTNLKRTSVGKNILIDDDTIVVFVPSLERKIWQGIYETPFLMSNCKGIVIPNKIFKINKKPFNGRIHYLEAKKHFVEQKNVIKKIPVIGSLAAVKDNSTEKKKVKEFYFYDTSMLMTGATSFIGKLPEKKIFQIILDGFKDIYRKIKEEHPKKRVIFVLDILSKNDLFYYFLINFKQLRMLLKDTLSGDKFFDGFLYASINKRLLPTLEYDDHDVLQPLLQMIKRIDSYLENAELADEMDGAPAISDKEVDDEPDKIIPNKSLATKIVDALTNPDEIFKPKRQFVPGGQVVKEKSPPKTDKIKIKAKADDEDDGVKIELDGKTLSKVMKYYKVSNPDIIANVKAAIDEYIKETGAVPTKANAELLVLKAVNKSIHGTDEIDEAYLSSPNLLFDKLKEVNVFSVPLEFPKQDKVFPFDVSDVVTLKSTTGQHRQQFEFQELIHENIRKVFSVLEEQKHPIKVLGITHEYVDNNSDRYIEYTIMLQNMDGNKQKYPIKLNIPTTINEKYFKLGGNKYIFSSQQHFKVLTKTKKNAVRILTNYTTIEMSLENMKFNISDIYDALQYVQQRYSSLLVEVTEKHAEFSNGDKIYLCTVQENLQHSQW